MTAVLRRGWHVLVPATLALLLGLWGIASPAAWFDERFTTMAVIDGLGSHLWEAPLLPYYAVMWLWSGGGRLIDPGWLRLLSVLAVAVACALVALTAARLGNRKAGLAAGLVLALLPGVSRYAQEARAYALALVLVTGATYLLVRAMQGGPRRLWIGYGVLLGCGALLLPVALAVLPAHVAVLTGFEDWRRRFRDWVAVLLLLTPIVVVEALMAMWFGGMRAWLERPSVLSLMEAPTLVGGSEYTGTAGAAVALALVVLGLLTPVGARWLGGLAISISGIWLVSLTVSNFWIARSFIPFSGILAVAAGLAFVSLTWVRALPLLGVLALVGLPAHMEIRDPASRGPDARAVAALMSAEGALGDRVLGPSPEYSHTIADVPFLAAWTASHLLLGDPRFTIVSEVPMGRYWESSAVASCSNYREWALAGDDRLRLCL